MGTALARSWDHWVDLPVARAIWSASSPARRRDRSWFTDNTTVNLYKLASAALDARPGRPVIVHRPGQFPSDRYVLRGHRRPARRRTPHARHRPQRRPGARCGGARRWTSETGWSACLTWRTAAARWPDMAAITRSRTRPARSSCGICATRSAPCPSSSTIANVDLAVGCTYKYLKRGSRRPAFLYVSARLRDVLRQPIWGWFSQRDQFAMGPRYDRRAASRSS